MKTTRGACFFLLGLLSWNPASSAATLTVCDEAALRANVAQGGIVHITCDGVIVLSNVLNISLDTEIDATGYQVVISGNDLVPIFSVPSGVSLTLRNLIVAHGRSTAGAGIFNRGRLLLDHCSLMDNQAIGHPGARGGNGANAPPRPPAPPRDGSPGGSGGGGGSGTGGGLFNFGDCLAIWSTFASNRAIGGVGGRGGDAGFPNFPLGNLVSGGSGGPGGLGLGGGIANYGQLVLSNCCLHGNHAVGGKGGNDGFGFPNFDESFVGYGGPGGVGFGAAIHNEGTLAIINTTLANNDVAGGEGGGQEGLGGNAFGGGLSSIGQAAMTNCTIASNQAQGGLRPPNAVTQRPPQGVGSGAGLAISNAAVTLKNTLLDNNQPGSNCLGPIIDAGNNLSSDDSCPFTSTGSQTNVALHLAALAENGGPILTMALSPFSPAIDAADGSACPPTDQRGLPRPALAGYDIGAYELQPDSFGLRAIEPVGSQEVRLLGFGPPGASFRAQRTSDFVQWFDAGMGTVAVNGLFEIVLPMSDAGEFLRLVSP